MTEYTQEDLDADLLIIQKELDDLYNKDQEVLKQVKAMVSKAAFQQIEDSLADSGYTHTYQIVDSPAGKPQDDGFILGEVFVYQTSCGGISGDDYSGTMSMPLG
ncbi:MAG: hypothetical protein RSG77_20830, partial [Hafnia sp.]